MSKNADGHELFADALDLMILHSLRLKPVHGYALAKHIEEVCEDLLKVEPEFIYPALRRLFKKGLFYSEDAISATNRRIQNYRLSEDGIKHLAKARSRLEKILAGISRVIAVQ